MDSGEESSCRGVQSQVRRAQCSPKAVHHAVVWDVACPSMLWQQCSKWTLLLNTWRATDDSLKSRHPWKDVWGASGIQGWECHSLDARNSGLQEVQLVPQRSQYAWHHKILWMTISTPMTEILMELQGKDGLSPVKSLVVACTRTI